MILKEHRESHCRKAGQCQEIGAVEPVKLVFADVVEATLEEIACAKKFPRPELGRKLAVSWSF